MTKDMPLKCLSSTVTGETFWRDDMDSYWKKEMKDNFDEEDGPTCVLYPLLYFFEHQNRLAGRWGGEVKNNESVFQADHKKQLLLK